MITFVDMTELLGPDQCPIPDVFVAGSVSFPRYSMHSVEKELREIKQQIVGHSCVPVKWNIRDVKRWMTEQVDDKAYDNLLRKSDEIRTAFLNYLRERADDGAFGLIGVIEARIKTRNGIQKHKTKLVGRVFANVLQRLALEAQRRTQVKKSAAVVIDWPDGAESKPFLDEYQAAWKLGYTAEGSKFYAGPLANLGFAECPLFASCRLSPGLQLADIFVGAAREFIQTALGDEGKRHSLGHKLFLSLIQEQVLPINDKTRRVLGYGVFVSPSSGTVAKKLQAALGE